MKTITGRAVGLFALTILLPACGAIFNGGAAKVTFTSEPNGAEVWVDGARRGTTPTVLDLAKNQDYTVVFKKAGYKDVALAVTKQVGGGYVVLDVLGGLLPVVVDAATGSWYVLSTKSVHGTLESGSQELVMQGVLTPRQLDLVKRGIPFSQIIEIPEDLKTGR